MGHILTRNVFFNLRIESTLGSLVTPLEFGMGISLYVINILIIYEDSQFEVVFNRFATILLWLKVV
jgi:hypothetical protein